MLSLNVSDDNGKMDSRFHGNDTTLDSFLETPVISKRYRNL